MNKNSIGFTLVELLLVLSLISILATISIVSINKISLSVKEKTLESQYKTIENAAQNYVINNLQEEFADDFYVTIEFLANNQYLNKKDIINPITSNVIEGCVHVNKVNGGYRYNYTTVCS